MIFSSQRSPDRLAGFSGGTPGGEGKERKGGRNGERKGRRGDRPAFAN